MTDDAASVRLHADRALAVGQALRRQSLETRAASLASAAALLSGNSNLGREARDLLPESTGLSHAMVDWALRTTLDTVERDSLLALARAAFDDGEVGAEPLSLLSLVLAGNVFTAPTRAVVVPLLLGVPIVVKTSTKETHFASLLRRALCAVDGTLGEALQVVCFARGERGQEQALVERAEAVGIYGGDDAVSAIVALVARKIPVVPHGHGVSVGFVGAKHTASIEVASRLALDVAAYDQRGCLSPSVVYVEGDQRDAEGFAASLSAELESIEQTLPRGPLPDAIASAQVQWRGLAMVDGVLRRGTTHSVAVRPPGLPRWSPGYRNVAVVPVETLEGAIASMDTFSQHLKCVGVDDASIPRIEAALRARRTWQAYATPFGTMQTPALDAPQDGEPIWKGLLKPLRPPD